MALPVETSPTPGAASPVGGALAEFTRRLAAELAAGSIDLPSFPEVAVRVRRALADEGVTVDAVVRIVSAEPSLAVRLLQLANSVALNPAGQRVTTLRSAVARVGFSMARSLTMAFAMSQMRRADSWRGMERRFDEVWLFSARLASTAYVLSRRCGRADADEALLAGMLHAVGRLFVLTRMGQFPALLADAAISAEILNSWQARASRSLLLRWDLAPEVLDAASDFENPSTAGAPTLSDVLLAARQMMSLHEADDLTQSAVLSGALFQRLGFDVAGAREVIQASLAEVDSLLAALAD